MTARRRSTLAAVSDSSSPGAISSSTSATGIARGAKCSLISRRAMPISHGTTLPRCCYSGRDSGTHAPSRRRLHPRHPHHLRRGRRRRRKPARSAAEGCSKGPEKSTEREPLLDRTGGMRNPGQTHLYSRTAVFQPRCRQTRYAAPPGVSVRPGCICVSGGYRRLEPGRGNGGTHIAPGTSERGIRSAPRSPATTATPRDGRWESQPPRMSIEDLPQQSPLATGSSPSTAGHERLEHPWQCRLLGPHRKRNRPLFRSYGGRRCGQTACRARHRMPRMTSQTGTRRRSPR